MARQGCHRLWLSAMVTPVPKQTVTWNDARTAAVRAAGRRGEVVKTPLFTPSFLPLPRAHWYSCPAVLRMEGLGSTRDRDRGCGRTAVELPALSSMVSSRYLEGWLSTDKNLDWGRNFRAAKNLDGMYEAEEAPGRL